MSVRWAVTPEKINDAIRIAEAVVAWATPLVPAT